MLVDLPSPEATRRALANSIRRKSIAFAIVAYTAFFVTLRTLGVPSWVLFSVYVNGFLNTYSSHRRLISLAWADVPEQLDLLSIYLPSFARGTAIIGLATVCAVVAARKGGEAEWAVAFAFGLAGLAAHVWLVPDIKAAWGRMRELATG